MSGSRFQVLLSAFLAIIVLFQITNGNDLTEPAMTSESASSEEGQGLPQSTTDPVSGQEEFIPTAESVSGHEADIPTTENVPEDNQSRNGWRDRLRQIKTIPRQCYNYIFHRGQNAHSQIEQSTVDVVNLVDNHLVAASKNKSIINVKNKLDSLTVRADQKLSAFATFRQFYVRILSITLCLTVPHGLWFLLYLAAIMLFTFMQTLWAFKGTLTLLMATSSVVTYAIGAIEADKKTKSSPTPNDASEVDPESALTDEETDSVRMLQSIEKTPNNEGQQNQNEEAGHSSTFWIWMVAFIVMGIIIVFSTGFFVYKKLNRRKFESEDIGV